MTHIEYSELVKIIKYHMKRYYDEDSPEISDYEYDLLMQKLKGAELEHPEWVTSDSPSQKVGAAADGKIKHEVPMLSIEDVFTKEDVIAWVNKVKAFNTDITFSVETKIDGVSMTARYQKENDFLKLILAESRGNGEIGEDVTKNALVIKDSIKRVDLPYDELQLRGEVYMTHKNFDLYNEEQDKMGKKLAANPRNLAAGTLRLLDSNEVSKRGLNVFFFNVQKGPDEIVECHTEALDKLAELGVPVVWHTKCSTAEEVIDAIDKIADMRSGLDYDIDGAVVKINETKYRKEFPAGSKYSAGHIAYKYPPEERVVVMDEIIVDVGRTGKLTYTGVFHDKETGKACKLCGTSVTRATLHNQDYINDMSIGIGGEYKLFKSGEIIPKLNGCVTKPKEVFCSPKCCPVCGEPLEREADTADIRCVNPSCPAQLIRTVEYFASSESMNIMGLGEAILVELINNGYISDISDIYALKDKRDELIEKKIIGKEKNTDKVLAEIEKSKTNEAYKVLIGLGIRNIGRSASKALIKHFKSISALMNAPVSEITKVDDMGETTADCIVSYFSNEKNKAIIAKLEEYGLTMEDHSVSGGNLFEGQTVVVTGSFENYSRKDIESLIENNGGKMAGSVSKKTSFVVAGESAGSKLDKANSLGIKVVSIEEFLNMLS